MNKGPGGKQTVWNGTMTLPDRRAALVLEERTKGMRLEENEFLLTTQE